MSRPPKPPRLSRNPMGSPSLATACGKLAIAARHPLGNDGPLGLAITAGSLLHLADSAFWLGLCSQTVHECSWLCHAYCQMTNHFHLLVETPDANISDGMQTLNSEHAQWSNWRYGYRGHLFQGRFHSELVEDADHFLELSRYVVLNPVRAGLCAHADDWPWSSYG